MKIILGLCSLIICIFVGYFFSKKFSQRLDFFNAFNNFNKRFKNEVGYTKNSIINLIEEETNKNDFHNYLLSFLVSEELKIEEKYLNKDDVIFFNNYLKNLCTSDTEMQIKYLESIDRQIELKVKEANDNDKKYRTLYIKLGFLIGLIIFIVLL